MAYLKKRRIALVSVVLAFMLLFSYSVSFNLGNTALSGSQTAMAEEEQVLPAENPAEGTEGGGGAPGAGDTGDGSSELQTRSLLPGGVQLLNMGGGGGSPQLPDVSGDPNANYIDGNCSCPHSDCFLIKIDDPTKGSHTILGGKLKYTVNNDRTVMTWELVGAPAYIIKEVHMKGGNGYNQYVYTNSPTSGTCYSPLNPNNQQRREISHICFLGSALPLEKHAVPTVARVGDIITYSLVVTNNGEKNLSDVVIYDAQAPDGQITVGDLKPGESVEKTYTRTVASSDLPGPIVNTAQAEGKEVHKDHTKIFKSNEATCTVNIAAISLTKTPSPTSGKVGDTIVYTYTITNTGSAVINALALTDDKIAGSIALGATSLAPDANTSGTASYVIQESDITIESDVKVVRNPATATGTACCELPDGDDSLVRVVFDGEVPCPGIPVTATASSTVSITEGGNNGGETPAAGITLDKTADKTTAANGEIITYSFKIKNTGNYTLTVTLTDSIEGTIAMPDNVLDPGEEITATKTHTVAVTDPAALTNTATATGRYLVGEAENSVSASDSWTVVINRGTTGGGTTGTTGGGGGTSLPERIFNSSVTAPTTIPAEQEAVTVPKETPVTQPLEVPAEPEAASPGGELPYTGGAALPYMLGGILALLGAAVAARRYYL